MANIQSKYVFLLCWLLVVLTAFFYYPKWEKEGIHATLSYDTAGYYLYLPALFIYKDIKQLSFVDEMLEKYRFSPSFVQGSKTKEGQVVIQYPSGQALQFLPFFAVAHIWASNSERYPADGFSYPYQFLIGMSSLFFAFLGLYFLRRVLLYYYEDWIVSIVLIGVVFGSNYLIYSAMSGAMTHNNLFMIYAMLIYATIQFYKRPTLGKSLIIGGLVGVAALTRPTEILVILIPFLWGVDILSKASVQQRISLIMKHKFYYLSAALLTMVIGSLQLVYWKYVTGSWMYYSYGDQGFSWLKPHIINGLFSYKCGWLMYSPLMIIGVLGLFTIYKRQADIRFLVICYFLLFIYIAFSWDNWWYGGSVGQRTMVQIYPILAFPMASFIQYVASLKRFWKVSFYAFFIGAIYISLWVAHQSHRGGMIYISQMTKAYYWKVLGTFDYQRDNAKLLDTDEYFDGVKKDVEVLYKNDFEGKEFESNTCQLPAITGVQSLCLIDLDRQSWETELELEREKFDWIQVGADYRILHKQWTPWKMLNITVGFYQDEKLVKERFIRLQRMMNHGETRNMYFDVSSPEKAYNRLRIVLYNPSESPEVLVDNVKIIGFNE